MLYDVIIIGGGPAAMSAGIYSARKRLKTLLISYELGGQSTVSAIIENWIGIPSISGKELGQQIKQHLESYRGEFLEIVERVKANKVEKTDGGFSVIADNGQTYGGKTVVMATGSKRRKLTVPGAEQFEHKGITYCATCDAPMFSGSDAIAVVGGGNAGFGTASQLTAYAKKVYILERSAKYRADSITVEKVIQNPSLVGLMNAELLEVKGDKFVSSFVYKDTVTGVVTELPVQGVFVEIGNMPASEPVKDLVKTNEMGAIVIDARNQRASQTGIWAAGDCSDMVYHQNNIAAAAGIIAIEDIYEYLMKK
jgi:alkyl hydroperoxide reductase subunit F